MYVCMRMCFLRRLICWMVDLTVFHTVLRSTRISCYPLLCPQLYLHRYLVLRLPCLCRRADPFQFVTQHALSRLFKDKIAEGDKQRQISRPCGHSTLYTPYLGLRAVHLGALCLAIQPLRVVSAERKGASIIELEDPSRHIVEEVAVVRNGLCRGGCRMVSAQIRARDVRKQAD